MKRLAILWLTLLGAFWLTRAVVSALLFQHAVRGAADLVLLALVPLAQALAIFWITRPGPPARTLTPGPSPGVSYEVSARIVNTGGRPGR